MSTMTPHTTKGDEMNHTPGPWKIADNLTKRDSIEIYGNPPNNTLVAEIRDPESLQETPERAIEEATMRSNAHLIAAAPELLAALREIVVSCEDGELGEYGTSGDWYTFAKRAIAKAEGKE